MDKFKVISRTKHLLGGEVLSLEISDDSIGDLVEMAFTKIKPYITDTVLLSKPFAQVISLEGENVEDVVRVYPADSSIISQDRMFDFEGMKLDRRSMTRSILGSYSIVDTEIHFKYYNEKLYLESDKVYSGVVTVEALVTPSLEDLRDERAKTWIESYTLALAKQVLGRIRTKFKSPNVPVEMDGDTLLNEAQTEIQSLEAELQERQFGPFMILR